MNGVAGQLFDISAHVFVLSVSNDEIGQFFKVIWSAGKVVHRLLTIVNRFVARYSSIKLTRS